jgi:phosphonate transport system permease protein
MTAASAAASSGARLHQISPVVEQMLEELAVWKKARRIATVFYATLLLACLLVSAWMSDVSPAALAQGLPRVGAYFEKLMPHLQASALFGGVKTEGSLAYWFYRLDSWAWLLLETSQMALLATLIGAVVAFLASFIAAANLAPSRGVYLLARRTLELFRCVPDIVYALILVWAFGVGPMAGIFAIALHTVGALGKQFAEVVENIDMGPWEAVRATGGTWAQAARFAVLPAVLPNFLSYFLLRFEINVRGAAVIGFVGAGGIGQELYQVISSSYYEEISAIIVLIIITVAFIDLMSERLRSFAMGAA